MPEETATWLLLVAFQDCHPAADHAARAPEITA
jgi:hypothetical protein